MAKNKPHIYKKKENGKNDTGRPSEYRQEYCQDMIDFFKGAPRFSEVPESRTQGGQSGSVERHKQIPAPMPTFFRYADKIGVNDLTLQIWSEEHEEFFIAYNKCKALQKEWLLEIGLSGMTPPASFIFIAKNVTDMRDKVEQDINLKTYEHFKNEKGEFSK